MPDALLLNEECFLLQAKFPSQPDSALQPHLHLASEWEAHFLGQLCGRSPPAPDPTDIALAGPGSGVKTEFALTHDEESSLGSNHLVRTFNAKAQGRKEESRKGPGRIIKAASFCLNDSTSFLRLCIFASLR
jgi:hypothetical protein